MRLNQYQRDASRTADVTKKATFRAMIAGLGLAGETGEVVEHIKKWVGHGHDLDVDKVKKELGDVLWYIAELATVMDLSMEEIARANIRKLEERYPKGFNPIDSITRVDNG
jgi:NTP pyrophosphatase (non-canonical NTP hydrolase)